MDFPEEAAFRPHLAAIRASVRAGFHFRHLPNQQNVLALQGFRSANRAMDVYLVHDRNDALAARYRLSDLDQPNPPALWHQHGTVADVVTALLDLPENGTREAPARALRRPSDLWIPRHVCT